MNARKDATVVETLLYTPPQVAQALNIGETRAYELIASGQIASVRIGTSVRVPVEECRAWVRRQMTGGQS